MTKKTKERPSSSGDTQKLSPGVTPRSKTKKDPSNRHSVIVGGKNKSSFLSNDDQKRYSLSGESKDKKDRSKRISASYSLANLSAKLLNYGKGANDNQSTPDLRVPENTEMVNSTSCPNVVLRDSDDSLLKQSDSTTAPESKSPKSKKDKKTEKKQKDDEKKAEKAQLKAEKEKAHNNDSKVGEKEKTQDLLKVGNNHGESKVAFDQAAVDKKEKKEESASTNYHLSTRTMSNASNISHVPFRKRLLTPITRAPRVNPSQGRVSIDRMEKIITEELKNIEKENELENRRRESFLTGARIAEGTTACVYKGFDRTTDVMVALKVFDKQQHSLMEDRVKTEAKIQDKLARKCKYIAPVRGVIDRENSITIVFDYLDNGDLFDFLVANQEESGGLTDKKFIYYALNIGRAIDCMHDHNIVHRDIKLENVCLTQKNMPQLIDFGEAAYLADVVVGYVGTVTYMAPEVFKLKDCLEEQRRYFFSHFTSDKNPEDNHEVGFDEESEALAQNIITEETKAADVWSLGILYFALIYGQFPWYQPNKDDDLYTQHLIGDSPIDMLPDTWAFLLHKMLIPQATERWGIKSVIKYLEKQEKAIIKMEKEAAEAMNGQ